MSTRCRLQRSGRVDFMAELDCASWDAIVLESVLGEVKVVRKL